MPRPAGLVRPAFPSIGLAVGLLVGVLLLLGAVGLAPSPAIAADPAPESAPAATETGSTNWGPIVGACLGVLFGSLLAAWQIRGMKRDR